MKTRFPGRPKRERVYDGFVKVDVVHTKQGDREVVVATDSVAFLVYDADADQILLVTQDRAPMMSNDNPQGTITEVAAGRVDEPIGIKDLIIKECKEELGVSDITLADILILNGCIPLALSPGVLTEMQYLAFVVISSKRHTIDRSKRVWGNAQEGERIKREFISVLEFFHSCINDMKTWALREWFRSIFEVTQSRQPLKKKSLAEFMHGQ